MPRPKLLKPCAQCGDPFWPKGHAATKYCSRECQTAARATGEHRDCPICGARFYAPAWDSDRRTCSHECGLAWRSVALTGEKAYHWKGGVHTRTCAGCGETFTFPRKGDRRLYCTHDCYAAHQSRVAREAWPWAVCVTCRTSYQYDPRANKGVACSNACRIAFSRGANAPGFIHGKVNALFGTAWSRIRAEAVRRDGGRCQGCGKTKEEASGRRLHVHHIIPRALFGDVESANAMGNLVTLCPSCHGKAEKEARALYRTGQLHLLA